MSDTPTDADLDTAIEGAEGYVMMDDFQTAYDVLEPIHQSGAVSGERLGRVSYLLGEACLGLDGLDAAMYYFEEAQQHAPAAEREKATARIEEIRRRDDAVDAVDEGVAGDDEATTVLATANDALGNQDYATAREYFQYAYDGIQMSPPLVAKAAVGLAWCHLHDDEAEMAEGYLQVAESQSGHDQAEQIAGIRDAIAQRATGDEAMADGVDRAELDELQRAGLAAAHGNDWEGAYRYFEAMYESGLQAGSDRGRAALNLGICCLMTHDYDAAHQYLTEASNTARPELASRANDMLARLSAMDDAAEIVHEIDVDRDMADAD